ncbi:helix-turn-helix domain-containing protein [Paraburkholderia silvatlantica]|uniref:AraC-like ligand-binding domain-containing protein n=1 Tax=Paraburkholderia silvatlantica TaxID=321895 RepID=UPI0010600391|nr:AraC family transcriptional regulator [Paraburkholderia silvatlantica]TDQ98531.1 AraC family transcriptional regulator [Paraburkholderia silvatlantica]
MDAAISPNLLRSVRARDDVERAVARLLGPHRMAPAGTGPLRAELYDVVLPSGGLAELCYGRATRIDFDGNANQYLFRLTLAGGCELHSGRDRAAVASGSISVSSPACASRIDTSSDCRSLLLRLDRAALERKLADLLQATPRAPLRFALAVDTAHRGGAVVRDTLGYLQRLCALPPAGHVPLIGADLTEWLMTVLLTQLPHSYSDALARDAARMPLPAHVRRARDYIAAHLDEPLALATLARVAGVSARTLQNGFARFVGMSPAEYVREQRLEAVHAALERDPQARVADAMLACGVQSFAHFTKAYVRRFGHPPSTTRRLAS